MSMIDTMVRLGARNSVPCGDCHLCCRMMTPLHIEKGDDPSQYRTAIWLSGEAKQPVLILDRHPNGDCIYLGERGCTIHDRAPWVCRDFDCRRQFAMHTRRERRLAIKDGEVTREILERGRMLIEGKA